MLVLSLVSSMAFQVAQEIPTEDFDRLDASGGFDIELTVGDAHTVRVEGPEDKIRYLRASVNNGELNLDWRYDGVRRWFGNNGGGGITVYVSAPAIRMIDVGGAIDLDGTGFSGGDLTLDVSSASSVHLEGSCDDLRADVSSAGDLDARDLECISVNVDASSAGDAKVYASRSVIADASSAASITVYGDPADYTADSSSAGSVRRR